MKLDNIRNIRIYQKALYSKQLFYYSRLCELYKELALLQGPKVTAEQIQERYSTILSIAAHGNLSDFITDNDFSQNEIQILNEYARVSRIIQWI